MVKVVFPSARLSALRAAAALFVWTSALAIDRAIATDVVVLANRTGGTLALKFQPAAGPTQPLTLPANDVRPLFADGGGQVEFSVPGQSKRYQLDPNSAYYFGKDASGRVDMQRIGLGDANLAGRRSAGGLGAAATATITVKILVDEEEPARQFAWEQRLRRRVEAASEIIQRHCHVQLKVVDVGTWDSDDATSDFFESLAEFEKEVSPAPARVAIGFTSQFPLVHGRIHMAGTRGPLHSHILVREGSPGISEPEKLEFLVHELGHFLGATHSPERYSVMRPVLGDNLAGNAGFQIRFDPVNTLVIAMVGEEMRTGRVDKFVDLSADTKRQLQSIYAALSNSIPEDLSSHHFMRLAEAATNEPLIRGARRVMQSITQSGVANGSLPQATTPPDGKPAQRTGDALCDYFVRQAASVADTLPDDVAPSALLLALAVGMDDTDALLSNADARMLAQAVESPPERSVRVATRGGPTMLTRRDLVRRFFTAAYLAAALGPEAAKETCLTRELANAGRGSFSFALVAADRAGIRWGGEVDKRRFTVTAIVRSFSGANVMPDVSALPAELLPSQLAAQYGSADDGRFRQQLSNIDQRILNLPLYRTK